MPWAGFERTTKMPTFTLKKKPEIHTEVTEHRPGGERAAAQGTVLLPQQGRGAPPPPPSVPAQAPHPSPRARTPQLGTGAAALAEGRGAAQQQVQLCCSSTLGPARSPHYLQHCTRSFLPTRAPQAAASQDLFLQLQLTAVSQQCSSTSSDQQQQQLQSCEQAGREIPI